MFKLSFSKPKSHDRKPAFTHEINSDVYMITKELVGRHLKAMYAELNEDLKSHHHSSNQQSRPSSCHNLPRPSSPDHSFHTHQHLSSIHHDPVIPPPLQDEPRRQDDHDSNGQNHHDHEGNISALSPDFDIGDAEPLPRHDRRPESVEEPPRRDRDDVQTSALRTALGGALTPITNITPLPTPPAHAAYIYCYPVKIDPSQEEGFRSRNQTNRRGSRTPDHDQRSRHTGNIDRTVSNHSIQRHRGESEALKDIRSRILHWIEACLKRLECLPGRTIESFRLALREIPLWISLGERYLPELEKLEDRLQRFYLRINKHDDFYYIRSACDAAQMRVEKWSRYLSLAKHLSELEGF